MSRQIKINKYQGNTHFTVHVVDSYGTEHHLGFFKYIYHNVIQEKAEQIWSNETKREVSPLSKAIKECIEIDKNNNITSGNYDGLD